MSGVLLYHVPPYSIKSGTLPEMDHAGVLSRLAGQHDQQSSLDPRAETTPACSPTDAGDPVAGHHAYASGAVAQ